MWGRIGVRYGKKRGLTLSSWVLVVGLLALTQTREGHLELLLVTSAVVGVGYAGAQLFPLAMLPDVAADDVRRSGANQIGLLTGTWSGFELLGFATGPLLYGLVLSIGGFASGSAPQDAGATAAIVGGISWVPAALVALSLVTLPRYRLDDELRLAARGVAGPDA